MKAEVWEIIAGGIFIVTLVVVVKNLVDAVKERRARARARARAMAQANKKRKRKRKPKLKAEQSASPSPSPLSAIMQAQAHAEGGTVSKPEPKATLKEEQSASPGPLSANMQQRKQSIKEQLKLELKLSATVDNKLLQRGTTTVTDPAKHLTSISRQGMRERDRDRDRTEEYWMTSYGVEVQDFVERGETGTAMAASSSSSWLLGISGMRGVGKTSLLRSLRDSYTNASYFDQVFFVGAGTGCSVDKLQRVLSVYLGLLLHSSDNNSNDVPAMAKLISTSLKPKTFLLLIDDVRETLDLAAVGLPMPLGHNQKVIFTTRYPDICADMGCGTGNTATIRMKCLAHHHAWSLFKNEVGVDFTHAHPHIRILADKMVEECRGLPSAICALGRVMSTKRDVKEWRYAYDVLLKSKQTQVDEIQEKGDEGYSRLHQLEDTLQDFFF